MLRSFFPSFLLLLSRRRDRACARGRRRGPRLASAKRRPRSAHDVIDHGHLQWSHVRCHEWISDNGEMIDDQVCSNAPYRECKPLVVIDEVVACVMTLDGFPQGGLGDVSCVHYMTAKQHTAHHTEHGRSRHEQPQHRLSQHSMQQSPQIRELTQKMRPFIYEAHCEVGDQNAELEGIIAHDNIHNCGKDSSPS